MSTVSLPTLSPLKAKDLERMANQLRRQSLISTHAAKSGHPTTCLSCAEIMSVLFFEYLRLDLENPKNPANDKFILSKGHAAPILWTALKEAGAFENESLKSLRELDSNLEGHPTPRVPWVDVATGSLGQGLSMGVGMAIEARRQGRNNRIAVLLGDGELTEGSNWEAIAMAKHYQTSNLTAIVDINRLGQTGETMHGHDLKAYAQKFEAFGWRTFILDGHDIPQIVEALEKTKENTGIPSVILAKTFKGMGVSFLENQDGWHGKSLSDEQLKEALAEIPEEVPAKPTRPNLAETTYELTNTEKEKSTDPPQYKMGDSVPTRKAFGKALKKMGEIHPGLLFLDAEVKNSTYTEEFAEAFPDRFTQGFIAEQNTVGMAVGMACMGSVPFVSTFSCFLTRAMDQIRMASISNSNIKIAGSHSGISIGKDGPSQMGLEDIALFRATHGCTVLYPSDAVSTEKLVEEAANHPGMVYLRLTRSGTKVKYENNTSFRIGGSETLQSNPKDRVTLIGAGITVDIALEAAKVIHQKYGVHCRVIDAYSIKPLDTENILKAVTETGSLVTIEDHYAQGGLGEAVLSEIADKDNLPAWRFRSLAVRDLPKSGAPDELMERYKISSKDVEHTVKEMLGL